MAGLAEALPIAARLLAGFAAGATGFALAACLLLLDSRSHGYPLMEGWSILASFVAVPAAVVALMPFSGRLFCFGLALLAVLGTSFMDVSGADNPMSIIPFTAMCFAVSAVVAEACCMPITTSRPARTNIKGRSSSATRNIGASPSI